MQDILTYILKNITTVPDDVQIAETVEDDTTTYTITVNPSDVGRIIGKEGKVIKSIRAIMRVIAIQRGVHIRISVVSESDNQPEAVASEPTQTVASDDSLTVEV